MGIERRQWVEPYGGGNAKIEQLVWRGKERATINFFKEEFCKSLLCYEREDKK